MCRFLEGCRKGKTQVVEDYLEGGIIDKKDLSYRDLNGDTPLIIASSKGYSELVKILLKYGVDPRDTDGSEYSMVIASREGHFEIVSMILNFLEGDYLNKKLQGEKSLIEATKNRHMDIIELLLKNGVNIETTNYSRKSALMISCSKGFDEITKFLLEYGANPNSSNYEKITPLHKAAERGNLRMIKLLLTYGANIEDKDCTGNSILHYASKKGKYEIVRYLLENGADINATGNSGITPLHGATLYNHLEVVKILLEQGADTEVRYGYDLVTPLHIACQGGYPDIVIELLENGADINSWSRSSSTPLMEVVTYGLSEDRMEIVEILIDYNADITITDNYRRDFLSIVNDQNDIDKISAMIDRHKRKFNVKPCCKK